MNTIKIIVAGGRDFSNYKYLSKCLDLVFNDPLITYIIISGTARGVDQMGERYAIENNIGIERYPADWKKYGKAAGYIRNDVMAKAGDWLVAFWDGKSKGTGHMINLAKKHNLQINVIKY
jgi:hypothetical protein